MSPLASWWFYAPFILLIPATSFAAIRLQKNEEDELSGFAMLVVLGWSLINMARFLIYIIPFSEPAISSPYFSIAAILVGLLLYRLRGKYPFFTAAQRF